LSHVKMIFQKQWDLESLSMTFLVLPD